MLNYEPLTDSEWAALEPLFLVPAKRSRGKPHTHWRAVTNSIFYIFFTGLKWSALPKDPSFATKSVSHRWFTAWEKTGHLNKLLESYETLTQRTPMKTPSRRKRTVKTAMPTTEEVAS